MKDHKEYSHTVSFYEIDGASVEEACSVLQRYAKGVINPKIEFEYGYEGYESMLVKGWVPMTQAEKDKAKESRRKERERKAAAKAAAKVAAEEAEKEELRRLVEKYPGVV